ncbi:MAG: hypothetical protein A3D94_11315 [Alphaproteobacteria bacterium RIFCSPHIGHO2_12_FULL_66_14]|jgi:hypothetical protein|nr:MAG: hypothetical protein A3D94_11315 [Alphaproteobacteria bacterium RIFCSPHIGHO2_12_FULL_66_14]
MLTLWARCARVSLIAPLWLCAFAAHAATITVNTEAVPGPTPNTPILVHTLRLTGMFEQGDSDTLRRILVLLDRRGGRAPDAPLATVELSSAGGDLIEGLKTGYLFSEFDVATVVRKRDSCLSACALAFLGGTSSHLPPTRLPSCSLEIGSTLGFHNFAASTNALRRSLGSEDGLASERQGFHMGRAGAALLMQYAADMDIDQAFVAQLLSRATVSYDYLTRVGAFLALRVCPIGLDRPRISLAEQATNICNHSTAWLSPVTSLQARPMTARQARRRLLEYIQSNMLSFSVRGALADQLASYSVMRVERAVENLYADLRAAGVPLPEIVGPVFEVGGYQIGIYSLTCVVSLSPDDPDKYDVVIQGPKGMARAYRSAPEGCRRLFLYDQDAVINPRP